MNPLATSIPSFIPSFSFWIIILYFDILIKINFIYHKFSSSFFDVVAVIMIFDSFWHPDYNHYSDVDYDNDKKMEFHLIFYVAFYFLLEVWSITFDWLLFDLCANYLYLCSFLNFNTFISYFLFLCCLCCIWTWEVLSRT